MIGVAGEGEGSEEEEIVDMRDHGAKDHGAERRDDADQEGEHAKRG